MPVVFLSDAEAAAYGRYTGPPSRAELEKLLTTELIGKAETATNKERARQHPKLARHSATLAAAVETLLEITEYGEELSLEQVWESIDAIVPRRERNTPHKIILSANGCPQSSTPEKPSRRRCSRRGRAAPATRPGGS